jgi:hypothetical protein
MKVASLNRREFLNLLGLGSGLFTKIRALPAVSLAPLDLTTANESEGQYSNALPFRQRGNLRNAEVVDFYKPPKLSLMVGFIKDPQAKYYTLEEWAKEVGNSFDARKLVDRVHSAGFIEIIWYDKWIDGLVFHKTKTTTYMTQRDFLSDLAPACRSAGMKLIIYFNVFYDGNPEFEKWSCRDQRGRPIVFSHEWPANQMSLYSPFREKALEQVRELFEIYGVDGLWLDVPNYPTVSFDYWTQAAFHNRYQKPIDQATASERMKFAIDSTVNWMQEVARYARKLNPSAVVTYNGAYEPLSVSPRLAMGMAEAVDYFATELHTRDAQVALVPVLAQFGKPVEANYLLSDSWFTPLHGGVKTMRSEDEVDEAMARMIGGGLNLSLACTLSYDGVPDEGTLKILELAGSWLKSRKDALQDCTNFNDIGIVLGTVDPNDLHWPGGINNYQRILTKLEASLRQAGYLPGRIINCPGEQCWDHMPSCLRALIVPDCVNLSDLDREWTKNFIEKGGIILAFGRGAGLGRSGDILKADDMFGVHATSYIKTLLNTRFWLEWKGGEVLLDGPVVLTVPQNAQVLRWMRARGEGEFPLLTRNPVRQGVAYFCTATETAMLNSEALLSSIWEQVLGEPVWKLSLPTRYSVNIRAQKGRFALHILDDITLHSGIMNRYNPDYVTLFINTKLIPFQYATVIPGDRSPAISNQDFWKGVEIYPNPELTLLLE